MDEYLEARVEGLVQGVGFRYFVVREARGLGLGGYVKNLPDNAVEVKAEGPRSALDELCSRLEQGPVSARVQGVKKSWGEAKGRFSGFEVRY
jgi:acylphosphatase